MNRNYIKRIGTIGVVACILWAMFHFHIVDYFTIQNIKYESVRLRLFVADHYHASVMIYALSFIVLLVLGLPPTIPMVLLSGYLFGAFWGALYASIAAMIGSMISILLFRYCLRERIKKRYGRRIAYFEKQINTYGVGYLLVLHYTSVIPFFVINTIAALSSIPLGTLLIVSFVGSFPIYCIFAMAGRDLGTINTARDIFSFPVILIICLLVGMTLASMFLRKKNVDRLD